jgi:hypothetical protein
MRRLALAAAAVPIVAAGASVVAHWSYRSGLREARDAWTQIASRARPPTSVYSPEMVADLPEVAQRYFNHAISPGTPLRTMVELRMRGTFLLGDKSSYRTYRMEARQILHPPSEFVWMPILRNGMMSISGADMLSRGSASTRFWLSGLIPVASERTSPDLVRSAIFRSAMEGVWVPASLLPQNGVAWEQIGPDIARVRIQRTDPEIVLEMSLGPDGALREIVGQRWSNANPQNVFRLQPFGGTMDEEATFGGYTIPVKLSVGNHFGRDEYLPFFQAEVVQATFF